MINTAAMHDRDEWIESKGPCVLSDGFFLFADGSQAEDNPMGRLMEPPEDKWEQSKLICQYWLLVSQADEQQFNDFKSYLSGHGQRQSGWEKLFTERDRINHLKVLQQQAKRSRAKYMASKRAVKANVPYWYEQREQAEVDEQKRRNDFLSEVDGIQL